MKSVAFSNRYLFPMQCTGIMGWLWCEGRCGADCGRMKALMAALSGWAL